MTPEEREALVERMAEAILARRGFGFYTDPMEGGQDAYDISCETIEEARAALAAAEPVLREMWGANYDAIHADNDRAHAYLTRNVLLPLYPNIEPLPNLLGVCTQVDNISTEITTLRAENARLRDALERFVHHWTQYGANSPVERDGTMNQARAALHPKEETP